MDVLETLQPIDIMKLLSVNVVITHKNNNPAIEIRSLTTDSEKIKTVLQCAYNDIPMIVRLKFSDKMQSLNSCIEKGILTRDNHGKYYFLI